MPPELKKFLPVYTAVAMAVQGVAVGRLMHQAFKLQDQANFMAALLNSKDIELDEFERIAATQLGLLKD